MRLVLTGTVHSTKIALEALVKAGLAPALLLTLPAHARDRHSDYVDLAPDARAAGVPVHYTRNVNDAATLEAMEAVRPDLCCVVGWSQICRTAFLGVPRWGTIGFHPSPLPEMRGRAVIPWTILLERTETAATLFWIDEGLDSGPVLLQSWFAVDPLETAASLYAKHCRALARGLPEALALVRGGDPPRRHQDEARASYCARRTAEDGHIDWQAPARDVLRLIRAAGRPYPGAFTTDRDRTRKLTIFEAEACCEPPRYIGLPGQVQAVSPESLVIGCGDGLCIRAKDWRTEDGALPKLHTRLGRLP